MVDLALLQPGGRLSLVEGNPEIVPTEGARSVYYNPFLTSVVPVFNGTGWDRCIIPGPLRCDHDDTTKNPGTFLAGYCADLFVWNDAGTMRLTRGQVWSYGGLYRQPLERIDQFMTNGTAISNGPAQNRGTWVGTIGNWIAPDGNSYVRTNWVGVPINHVWNAYNKKLTVARSMPGSGIGGGEVSGWSRSGLGIFVVVGESTAIQIQCGCQTGVDVHIIMSTILHTYIGVADNLGAGTSYISSGTVRGLTRSRFLTLNDPHVYAEASLMFGPGCSDFEMWTHGAPRAFNINLVNPFSAIWSG